MNGSHISRAGQPVVSVIIPAYRHCELIRQTLDSVFAQTYADYEIIVVNDGSPDRTAEVLQPLAEAGRIRYFEQPNAGVAAARNRGLSLARGEFIAFLDDDDLWPTDKLAWQVEWLRQHPKSGIVAGLSFNFEGLKTVSEIAAALKPKQLEKAAPQASVMTFELLFDSCPFASPGQTMIRTDLARRLGGFHGQFWGTDDYDLWMRAARETVIDYVSQPALFYRVHPTNASGNFEKMLRNCSQVIRTNLAGLPAPKKQELYRRGQVWLYNYAGWRLANKFKAEVASGRLLAALKSLAVIMPAGFRDPHLGWLMCRHVLKKPQFQTWRKNLGQTDCFI